jgi:hypothetical protein
MTTTHADLTYVGAQRVNDRVDVELWPRRRHDQYHGLAIVVQKGRPHLRPDLARRSRVVTDQQVWITQTRQRSLRHGAVGGDHGATPVGPDHPGTHLDDSAH